MTGHLLDTNVVSYYVHREAPKRYPILIAKVDALRNSEGHFISNVSVYEILRGLVQLDLRGEGKRKQARVALFLAGVTNLPMDPCWEAAARLWAITQNAGVPLSEGDLMLASTAVCFDRALVTTDASLGERLKELEIAVEVWQVA
jgi:predicted nucleic acid-binding protein